MYSDKVLTTHTKEFDNIFAGLFFHVILTLYVNMPLRVYYEGIDNEMSRGRERIMSQFWGPSKSLGLQWHGAVVEDSHFLVHKHFTSIL